MKKNYFLKVLLITLIGLGTNLNAQTTTWTGDTSTNFNLSSNWSNGNPDGTTKNVVIPDVVNDPIIDSDNITIYGSFTLDASATLTITNGGNLSHINLVGSPTFTNNGSIIINSGSEFKTQVDDAGTGSFTYNRNLGTNNWYLVSSPFEGQSIDAFITAENLPSSNGDVALAPYLTATNIWDYIQTGASGSGNFETGKGYSVKLASVDSISFTGTLLTTNKTISLTTTGLGYNLIGNPYPIHLKSAEILSRNTASLDSQTIWLWNQATSSYEAKVSGVSWAIAPAQSFFVKSDGASGDLEIQEGDQQSIDDTFQRINPIPEIVLTLSNDSASRQATIYYIDDTTTGFDNGYDGPRYMAGDNSFAFYTHLVSDSEGVDYDIQSLPTDNYENMIVPIGINAISGTNITIDASITNFPEGINVYIEDKENNSFSLLDGDANFTTTLANDLNGIGRFYLHTTSEVLSSDDLLMNKNISIYSNSRENLRVVGVQNGTANIHIYNILGKEVFNTAFEGAGMNDIQLPNLTEGLYIINLTTDRGTINKKVIIQ